MTRRTRLTSTTPVDAYWRFDGEALARIGDQYRAWMQTGEAIQRGTTEYFAARMAKDADMVARLASCKDMAELFQIQSDYAREAFGDMVESAGRVSASITGATHSSAS